MTFLYSSVVSLLFFGGGGVVVRFLMKKVKPCNLNLGFHSGTKVLTRGVQMPGAWSSQQINFV
jgi:hypothetical protein